MIYGILLAAGFGRRYAKLSQGENKLLALLSNNTPIAKTSAAALQTAVDQVIAVVRPDSNELTNLLQDQGCLIIETHESNNGMGLSLATAANHLQQHSDLIPDAVIVALADMPWIKISTYEKIVAALKHHQIVAPTYQGKRGHPVGFNASLLKDLAELKADTGARSIIKKHGVTLIATSDPGILQDIDQPTDLLHSTT